MKICFLCPDCYNEVEEEVVMLPSSIKTNAGVTQTDYFPHRRYFCKVCNWTSDTFKEDHKFRVIYKERYK